MTDLFDLLDRYNTSCSGLSGWELASDRGNLSADDEQQLADLRSTINSLFSRASTRWADATTEEISQYDARVDALASRDGADPILSDAKRRGAATRSPTRSFDAWAIWITLKLTAP